MWMLPKLFMRLVKYGHVTFTPAYTKPNTRWRRPWPPNIKLKQLRVLCRTKLHLCTVSNLAVIVSYCAIVYNIEIFLFLNFPECFSIPRIFSNLNYNCSDLSDMGNLQEQVKKAFYYQKLFWPFNVWIDCSSDLNNSANSRPSASNFKSFSQSLEQYFLTVGQKIFGNKIPVLKITNFPTHHYLWCHYWPLLLLLRSSEYPGNHFFQQ